VNFSTQIHDLNPGIASNGLFWTIAVPSSAVSANPGAGTASFRLEEVSIPDWGNIPNSLFGSPIGQATASFEIEWGPGGEHVKDVNQQQGYAGQFVYTQARAEWSCSTAAGFEFTSDPASTSTSLFALVGHERNGVFFPQGAG
jgi:hypothetical protein